MSKVILAIILFAQLYAGYPVAGIPAAESENRGSRKIAAAKNDLFHAAKKILVLQGFSIRKLDEESGTLSTEVSPMRLNVSDCECGVTMGPVEDTRPIIHVSVAVKVEDEKIYIHADIIGDYPRDKISQEIIEDDLFAQISGYLK